MNEADIKLIKSWVRNPRKFVIEALRLEEKGHTLSRQQEKALDELKKLVTAKLKASEGKKLSTEEKEYAAKIGISIMSGQGTGKDAFASWVILWFLCCFPFPKIPCTAPTDKQLKVILWAEISKWLRDSHVESWLTWQSEKVFLKDHGGKEWFAVAKTVNVKGSADDQAETLAGFHEDFLMAVMDEASGIPDPVFKPIEGTMTGKCNFVLMIFNPTRSYGFAVDSHVKNRQDWVCLKWNAEESELVSRSHVERMERKYGRDSNAFRIRVKGLPPLADTDTLIPWDWVMNAVEREIEPLEDDPLLFGVDVGAGGDKSVILHRRGGLVERLTTHTTPNTMELTGWASADIDEYEASAVFVDVIGLGNGVYNRLKELGHSRVYPVDVRSTARNNDRFHRLRDEIWWTLREQFEKGTISIPNDDELICELTTIKYEPESNGKVKVEGKKEMKRRGLESPDKADALCLTYYLPESTFRRERTKRYRTDPIDERQHGWMVA